MKLDRCFRFLDSRATAWGCGVIMPVVMILLDPIVFRGSTLGFDQVLFGSYRTASYLGIGSAITALVIVLITGRAWAFLSGVMAAAAVLGFLLGLAILPFSVIGTILLGIGLLGLSPFLAAVVFGRWSVRTFRESPASHRRAFALFGAAAFIGMIVGAQGTVSRVVAVSINGILSGQPSEYRTATERLERWGPFVDMDGFIPAWMNETDPGAKKRLEDAYMVVTGEDLEDRATRAMD